VGGGGALRAHFVQDYRDAARRDLPGGFGAREPAADDVHCLHALVSHGTKLRLSYVGDNVFAYTKFTSVLLPAIHVVIASGAGPLMDAAAVALLAFVTLQRFDEFIWDWQNTQRLRAAGGIEFGGLHYPVMILVHASWLAGLWMLATTSPSSQSISSRS